MAGWTLAGWVITCGSALVLMATLAALRFRKDRGEFDEEDADSSGFTLTRYQPMARLLSEDDLLFLASQPGYRSELGARFLRERRRIFRLYLRDLSRDFQHLHAEARKIVANSEAQHAALVGLLLRQQVTFWQVRGSLELHLALSRLGIGKVDARRLVDAIESMRLDLGRVTGRAAATA